MKLALAIFRYFPHGGLQRDFMRIAQEALQRGHEVTVFTSEFDGEIPAGMQVRILKLKAWSNHGKAAEFERKFHAVAQGFDCKFGFNRISGLDFYFAADNCLKNDALLKYPRWFLSFSPRYRTFLRQEAAVVGANSSTRVFYIVNRQKADFQRLYHTPDDRLIFLPPGLNESCFRTADAELRRARQRHQLQIQDNEILLLLIGSFFEGKGGDRLIAAGAALPAALRSKCKIAIVGAIDRSAAQKFARRVGFPVDQLLLPGASDEVPEWLLAADLMVHPSRKEATGTVIIEALAAGTPVIASGECGFAFYAAESGGVALRCPFEQTELNQALTDALQPEHLAKMREQALIYSAHADFRRRAQCAVDAVERYHG